MREILPPPPPPLLLFGGQYDDDADKNDIMKISNFHSTIQRSQRRSNEKIDYQAAVATTAAAASAAKVNNDKHFDLQIAILLLLQSLRLTYGRP